MNKELYEKIVREQAEGAKKHNEAVASGELKIYGQLWEPCDFCGNEPVYMSHGCCADCAKEGYTT